MTCLPEHHLAAAPAIPRPDFNRQVYGLMGIPVDALRFDDVEKLLVDRIRSRSKTVWSTPNMNNLNTSLTDPRFKDALAFSELSTVDGMPLVLMAKMLDIPIAERVAGASVFERLMSEPDATIRVYFFGGTADTCRRAFERLNSMSKSMRCVGFHAPGYGPVDGMSSEDVLADINRARPDILVIALGTQRGHEWIRLNAHKLDVPVITHLGSVINFVGGTVARAPRLAQELGLEWLWRILQEPRLAPRYASDFACLFRVLTSKMLPLLLMQLLSALKGERKARPELQVEGTDIETTLRLKGAWRAQDLQPLRDALSTAAAARRNLRFDLSELRQVTPGLIGLLLLARGHQARSGLAFRITADNRRIRKLFQLHCVEHLLYAPRTPRADVSLVQSLGH
jgi:N-acetylglucosaminyldiphosphoundecaprenol N-acetyl-beta-D-mannosaminyltransferase